MEYGNAPLEVKALGDTGSFQGYASIFGNVDFGGDVVERGAFKEIVKTRDGQVRMLYQHDTRQPIGKATVIEDTKGLYFDGTLVLEDPMARKAYAMIKAGVMDGMSIGFDVLKSVVADDDVRHLIELKLWEISPVVFGMNELARIDHVKTASRITTIREFEDFLRDAGFSKARAKILASGGWKSFEGRQEADDEAARTGGMPVEVSGLVDFLKKIAAAK